jgi:dynein heavy chain, axonemal
VDFIKKVDPREKNVEFWMGDVERTMLNSVRSELMKAKNQYYLNPRTVWILNHPGQCIINGS